MTPKRAPVRGKRLLRFAVVADTHINQAEDSASSPYRVNRLANARTRSVISEINAAKVEFTLHLGDIVHPVPALPTYGQAVEQYRGLFSALDAPVYLTPGNHDIGDKVIEWGPVPSVQDGYIALYKKHFGRHYYSFDHAGFHFVIVNAQIVNSGLASEREQREWIETDLRANRAKRVFVATHYPPYLSERDEASSYDNIDEPGRSWLLELLARNGCEAVFCGHVHNFWYNHHAGTSYYVLPSTAFVRQDYSELARIGPGDEGGRDDRAKLGYFIVDVYEHGHVAHWIRTDGHCASPGGDSHLSASSLPLVHTKIVERALCGVDLRHPWNEQVDIPPTGALEEFARRRIRNDYPLAALWEMGIRALRVPVQDLIDPRTRDRMRDLRAMGHEFTVQMFDVPDAGTRATLVEHCALVQACEVILPWRDLPRRFAALAVLRRETGLRIHLSKLRTADDAKYDGLKYAHLIYHGFVVPEIERLREMLAVPAARDSLDALVFRVTSLQQPWTALEEIDATADALGVQAAVQLRLATNDPAEFRDDDALIANQVAEAVFAGASYDKRPIFFDTFMDVDRGYFRRNGFIDRRFNPRLASRVVRHLHAALGADPAPLDRIGVVQEDAGHWLALRDGMGAHWILCLAQSPKAGLQLPKSLLPPTSKGQARVITLDDGCVNETRWHHRSPVQPYAEIDRAIETEGPALVRLAS